jgi:hypothetical protein
VTRELPLLRPPVTGTPHAGKIEREEANVKRMLVMTTILGLISAGCGPRISPPVGRSPIASTSADRDASTPPPSTRANETHSPDHQTDETFEGTIAPIDAGIRARMSFSWRPGCPVPTEDLRLLTIDHWGFDGAVRRGEMIVHADEAASLVQVLAVLFAGRFPIERMKLVDAYGGNDDRSMAANNTSAFNCRAATGNPGVWSEHSYGRAIDINPVQNPYVTADGTVLPPAGSAYTNRSEVADGMIGPGDVVVRAFAAIGWEWGGDWSGIKDYQHFSSTGR